MSAAVLLDMIDERSGAMAHKSDSQEQGTSTATRSVRRNWAAAFAVGFAVVLVVGIAFGLLNRGGDSFDVAASATTVATTTPATTVPGVSTVVTDRINWVRSLAVATDGNLWAATAGGVVRWDLSTQTPTVYTTDDGLPADGVGLVAADSDGTVLVGADAWMARFDGTWSTFPAPDGSSLAAIAIGPDGSVWAALGEREVGRFDGSEWQVFEAPYAGREIAWASSLAVAPDGTVWAGLTEEPGLALKRGMVASFDGTDWTRYSLAEGLPGRVGNFVAVEPDGTAWAGSAGFNWDSGNGPIPGGGAARFDGTNWTGFTIADGLPSDDVDIAIGSDGSVWAINVFGDGVARFNGTEWTPFPDVDGFGGTVDATGTLWLSADDGGGIIGFDGVETVHLIVPVDESAVAAAPTTTIVPAAGDWNPILAETQAKTAPPAAACPAGTDSNAPGPADQKRPEPGWVSNQAGAFDRHTGRIVYVDVAGETWTFDVCTSTWQNMKPEGVPIADDGVWYRYHRSPVAAEDLYFPGEPGGILGELVYDVDSDRTINFGPRSIAVYDANTNTWTQRAYPLGFDLDGNREYHPNGVVYDPLSGLVVARSGPNQGEVAVYDVDTDQWTSVGSVAEEGEEDGVYRFLVGYSAVTDQLIFQGREGGRNGQPNHSGVVANVRDGGVTALPRPGPDGTGVFGWFAYATDTDTALVLAENGRTCGFDPVTLDWDTCIARHDFLSPRHTLHAAMVGDPINNRLILIHGNAGPWSSLPGEDDVWAIDLDTGEWTQLLAPSSP